ncbi:MAG: paaX [Candidatus Berkelbacteria bacterium]|nr:paaX [Candidatus Berkelbacteria bacterium]
MPLSPLQEVFILLEDEKKVPLYRLNRWGKQVRGVLAKLKNYGWAEKIVIDEEPHYIITPKGEREFDRVLKNLRDTGHWDGRWRLVIFNVPEKQRDLRDRIRRSLRKLGMGILQPSVWISPKDIKKDIDNICKRLNLQNQLKYFEVSRNNSLDNTIIEKSWKLSDIEEDYKRFNFNAQRIINVLDKDANPRFSAKKHIYEYALILQKDPILPWEFRNKDLIRRSAHNNYLKLRQYAV